MACSGTFCSAYGVGSTYCSGHRAPNSGNPISVPNIAAGNKVQVSDVNTLRNAINAEIVAWNTWITNNGQGSSSNTNVGDLGVVSTSTLITSDGYTDPNLAPPVLTTGEIPQINWLDKAIAQINLWTATNPGQISGGGYPGPAQATTKTKGGTAENPGINLNDGVIVSSSQWNAILTAYNSITQDCICNSDCACNAVCACYNDCGCNYTSDTRVKTDIKLLDIIDGINIYEFTYIWDRQRKFIGVMAQELLDTPYKSAVLKDAFGFYSVDYSLLPFRIEEVSLCTA